MTTTVGPLALGSDNFWLTSFSWNVGNPQPVTGDWSISGAATYTPSAAGGGGGVKEAYLRMQALGQATTFALAPVIAVPPGTTECQAQVFGDPAAGITLTLVGSDGTSSYDIATTAVLTGDQYVTPAGVPLPSGTVAVGMRIDIIAPIAGGGPGYYLQLLNPDIEATVVTPDGGGWGVGQIRMGDS